MRHRNLSVMGNYSQNIVECYSSVDKWHFVHLIAASTVLSRMSPNIILFLLGNAPFIARSQPSLCTGLDEPKVTVADSDHLLVDWTNAFENCEGSKVQSVSVEYQTSQNFTGEMLSVNVTFEDKKAKVEANPCLKHSVTVKLKYEGYDVVSNRSSFNSELRMEDLYSGLLQKQVVEKNCIRKDGVPSIPIIPDEISNCVNFKRINTKKITWRIVDPQDETKKVKIQSDHLECSLLTEEGKEDDGDGELQVGNDGNEGQEDPGDGELQKGKAHNATKNGTDSSSSNETVSIAIGASVLAVVTIATVAVVCLVCSKKKQEEEAQSDPNPLYDGGRDYDYYEDNYDTMEASNRRKKEVKDEVVDRNSIYGEKEEEGWEDVVVVDENPNYEVSRTDTYSAV